MRENQLGGVTNAEPGDMERAKKADLITLPPAIKGTNCFNCKYISDKDGLEKGLGYCKHPKVKQYVTNRMCCALWDSSGSIRAWEHK